MIKTFFALHVANFGFVIQNDRSVEFTEKRDDATLFPSKRMIAQLVEQYDFSDTRVDTVNVLMLHDKTEKGGARLFLTMRLDHEDAQHELFAVTLPASSVEACSYANGAVSVLKAVLANLIKEDA